MDENLEHKATTQGAGTDEKSAYNYSFITGQVGGAIASPFFAQGLVGLLTDYVAPYLGLAAVPILAGAGHFAGHILGDEASFSLGMGFFNRKKYQKNGIGSYFKDVYDYFVRQVGPHSLSHLVGVGVTMGLTAFGYTPFISAAIGTAVDTVMHYFTASKATEGLRHSTEQKGAVAPVHG